VSFVPHPQPGGDATGTQMRLPVQVTTLTLPVQLPLLHVVGVPTWLPLTHVGAPLQELGGYWQAPDVSQPVAPQGPAVAQAAKQQVPVPAVPQMPLEHWSGAMHEAPGAP
jgi:hypothetical protein